MSNDIGGPRIADRQRRCAPQLAAVVIAQINRLRRIVADGIVGPGRELILLRVDRPGAARAVGRHEKPELRIGDDVGPGNGRPLILLENRDVFAPAGGKAAEAVEEFERGNGARRGDARRGDARLIGSTRDFGPCEAAARRGRGCVPPRELRAQGSRARRENGARGGLEELAVRSGQALAAQRKHAAEVRTLAGAAAFLRLLDARVELGLELPRLGVGGVVEDHQVDRKPLEPPIFLGAQQSLDEVEAALIAGLDEHDGQIAGDAVAPKRGRPRLVPGENLRRGAQRRIAVQHPVGDLLELERFAGLDPQVAQARFRLLRCRFRGTIEGGRVAQPVGGRQGLRTARRDTVPEGHSRRCAGFDPHSPPQSHHGIEHRSDGVGQGTGVKNRHRRAQVPAASQESRSIGFELQRADGVALHDARVEHPQRRFARLAGAARRQQRSARGHEFGLDEHLGKCRMSGVGTRIRQHHFRIRGQFDFARAPARVGERYAPHLGVVLR